MKLIYLFVFLVFLIGIGCAPKAVYKEITIYTNPPGAMIKVNGMAAGYAPMKYPVRIENIGGGCVFAHSVWMPSVFDFIAMPKFRNPPGKSKPLYAKTLVLTAQDIMALDRPAVYLDLTRKPAARE